MKFELATLDEYLAVGGDLESYEYLKLPERSTAYSAGYDFYLPKTIELLPGKPVSFSTGVKINLDRDKFLSLVPRSSLGLRCGIHLLNTVGVIDSDFYDAGGIITVSLESKIPVTLEVGTRFMQGIIQTYYVVDDDNSTEGRVGGVGSTGI